MPRIDPTLVALAIAVAVVGLVVFRWLLQPKGPPSSKFKCARCGTVEAYSKRTVEAWRRKALQLAKKGADVSSVSYDEAIEIALCFGWIDGKKQAYNDQFWLQKFTRRSDKSVWSKINRDKALALIEAKKMKPAGLKEIERAKLDGRWDAAYDSSSKATVPSDFQSALDDNVRAKAFFKTLDSRNRYAVLFRIQTAKKADTRARRIKEFISMLEKKETLH
jgi:uncharacterized protein YdeI (YjbR/CyaY-like superfamily)